MDPATQEKALADVLQETERLRANGAFAYLASRMDGRVGSFPVTCAGLIAAGHRDAARALYYLQEGITSKRPGTAAYAKFAASLDGMTVAAYIAAPDNGGAGEIRWCLGHGDIGLGG